MSRAEQVQKDIARFKRAVDRKSVYRTTCQEVMAFACPQRDTFYDRAEGEKRDNADFVFDSTALAALNKFASNIQSSMVPPMKRWIRLEPGFDVPEANRKAVAEKLQQTCDMMFAMLQISNFDTAVAESFHDLAIGTGSIMVKRGTKANPFRFVSVPISQGYFEEAGDGRIGAKFREWDIPGGSINDVWSDAKIPSDLKQKIDVDPTKKIKVIEMILPTKVTFEGKKIDGFEYKVAVEGCADYLVYDKVRSDPWIVYRWSVVAGEVYGRGPLMTAIADIKTLNKTKELTLKAASMQIAGAWTVVDDGVVNVNTMQISPGAKIAVAHNEGSSFGASISRLDQAGDVNLSQLIINDLRNAINEIMFADPLGPIDLPVKSATEMSLRHQELSKRIGSSYGRLQYEFVIPLVNRLLHIMEELQLVNLSGFRVDGGAISVRAVSPLAMAQDEEDLMSMLRFMEHITGTFGPEAGMLLTKPDVYIKLLAKKLAVDQSIVPSDEEFAALKQRLAQISQAAMQGQGKGQVQ